MGHLKKTITPPAPTVQTVPKAQPLGHSLLASEYQLKLLSSQRKKAAATGSKKRIFITAPNYTEDDDEIEKPKKESVMYFKNESCDIN